MFDVPENQVQILFDYSNNMGLAYFHHCSLKYYDSGNFIFEVSNAENCKKTIIFDSICVYKHREGNCVIQ